MLLEITCPFWWIFLIFKFSLQYPLWCSQDCSVHKTLVLFCILLELYFNVGTRCRWPLLFILLISALFPNQSLNKCSITCKFPTGWLFLLVNTLLIFCKFANTECSSLSPAYSMRKFGFLFLFFAGFGQNNAIDQ